MSAFLYPKVKEHAPLEYGWGGYSAVTVFSTDDDTASVALWYQGLGYEFIDHSSSRTVLNFHLRGRGSSEHSVEVFAVDTKEEEAVGDLASYIGSKRLESFLEAAPATLGVLFIRQAE